MSSKPEEMSLEVAYAAATFAASAVARLIRVLHRTGTIDDRTLGEMAAVAQECAFLMPGDEQVAKAMDILQAQMGHLSPRQRLQQEAAAAIDEADEQDEADDEAR